MGRVADKAAVYRLLPFQFMRLDGHTLVVNQAGEFHVLADADFERLVNRTMGLAESSFLDLKSKHLVADGDLALPVKLLATKYRTKKAFLRNFTGLHMFVLTVRCNQKCAYCQVASENADAGRFDMQPEVAAKAVELVFRSPSPCVKIEFQGGEPFLNFSTMRHIVELAENLNKEHGKNLEFVVCTNLVEVSDEELTYCRDHRILISTSLDGPRDIHDAFRQVEGGGGSYDRVIEGIARAQDIVAPDRVSALMTTTRTSLGRFSDIVDEYVKRGFRGIFFRALNPYGRACRGAEDLRYGMKDFVASYKEGVEHIIGLNLNGKAFVEQYATLVLTRILTPFSTGFVDLQSPTGAGIGGVIYDYDGDTYVADEGRMLARSGDRTFRMGNVMTDDYKSMFTGDVIRSTVAASCVECLPECSECAFQMWCGADPVRNYSVQGDMIGHRPSSEFCRKNKAIIRYLFDRVNSADSDVLDVLWSWVTKRSFSEVRCLGGRVPACAE